MFMICILLFGRFLWVKSRRDFYLLCHCFERVSVLFRVESSGTLGSSTFSGPPISLLTRLRFSMLFDP